MDISKYRTRFPPKEHEEAVRMLLEGLDAPPSSAAARPSGNHDLKPEATQVSNTDYKRRAASALSKSAPARNHHEVSPGSSIDSGSLVQCDLNEEDDSSGEEELEAARRRRRQPAASAVSELHNDGLHFNSEDSSSQDQIQVSPRVASRHLHGSLSHRQQQSLDKLTNRRLMEQQLSGARMQSRATSTTSDASAMSGAPARSENDLVLGPADCASIPNRTIAIQCDLKVSSKKRHGYLVTDSASADLASMQASSISSTRFGFYRLAPDTLEQRRQLARSISSRNIAHRSDDEAGERALGQQQSESESSMVDVEEGGEPAPLSRQRARAAPFAAPASEISRQAASPLPDEPDERSLERRELSNAAPRSRARDSLPRRPKTALSYVSSGRLRRGEVSDRSQSEPDEGDLGASDLQRRRRLGQRAMSQQVFGSDSRPLARRPSAREQTFETISSSDGESGSADRLRVPRNEEILLTRRGQPVSHSATPSNYTSARTSAYADSSPTRRHARRSQTLTNGISELPTASGRALTSLTDDINHLNLSELEDGMAGEPARRAQKYTKFASSDEPRKLSRFSSMSLSRTGARAADERRSNLPLIGGQIRRTTRSTKEPPVATGVGSGLRASTRHLDASGREGATLTRKQRSSASGQATLAVSARRPVDASGSHWKGADSRRVPASCPSDSSILSSRIGRSSSMKQVNRIVAGSGARLLSPSRRERAPEELAQGDRRRHYAARDCDTACCEQADVSDYAPDSPRPAQLGPATHGCRTFDRPTKRSESEDSESPRTRTWTNPSLARALGGQQQVSAAGAAGPARNATHAPVNYEGRDEDFRGDYQLDPLASKQGYRSNGLRCASDEAAEELEMNSATWSLANEQQQQPLDFDSQQRLNEIGLPEHPNEQRTSESRGQAGASANSSSSSCSHLGVSPGFVARSAHYATTGRRAAYAMPAPLAHSSAHSHRVGPAITGRALSQQSLTRPTMPLSRRLRRSGHASGSQSGASDVGGSSMSLVSRMRYENAHTRSPVVMYIPQAMPKAASSEHIRRVGSSSLLRKSSRQSTSRAGLRHSSQDRARRAAASRQTSDSEASSSSMLRTLIRPRRGQTGASSGSGLGREQGARRRPPATRRDHSDLEEHMDGVGQLATEIDSYKFSRRYSVPKDAKINWFSKLKQRVTSSKA